MNAQTQEVPLDLRLSSLKTGSKANPRLVWAVGVPKDFVESLPEDKRKAKLVQKDGILAIQLNGEGIKLSTAAAGNFAYASSIGERHLNGLTTPEIEMTAQRIEGAFDSKTGRIKFIGELPDAVRSTFRDLDAGRKAADPETHFPGTHFMEDVKQAEVAETTDMSTIEGATAWFEEQVAKGRKNVHTQQVDVTPALAQVMLDHNDGNRPIRPAKLAQYVNDIEAGRWEFNGETMIISQDGLINNGQHRNHAVVQTGIAIPALLVFGVERSTRKTVDTGSTRGAQDHLSADGFTQPTTLSALTRFLLAYEYNDGRHLNNSSRITASEIYERARSEPLLDEASKIGYKWGAKSKRFAPASTLGFCYAVFAKLDKTEALAFMEQVSTGIGLNADDPAYVTRETLLSRSELSRELKAEVVFRGFLAFRKNKKIKTIRIKLELPELS